MKSFLRQTKFFNFKLQNKFKDIMIKFQIRKNFSHKNDFFFSEEDKNKNKFIKLSQNKNNPELPNEEENMENLLKQMNIEQAEEIKETTPLNTNYLIQKDNILFFSNIDENLRQIKLGEFIEINETSIAQCISIKENLITCLLVDKEKIENPIKKISFKIKNDTREISNLFGKCLNSSLTSSLTKLRKRRNQVNEMIQSGNLIIDFVSPLFAGNFNVLTGASNLGQKNILNSLALNHVLKNSNTTENHFLIYITLSQKEAFKLKESLASDNKTNFVIFTLSENPSDSEYYYLPRVALNFANLLINNSNGARMNILFCFDDVSTYLMKEKNIFNAAKSYSRPSDVFADIRESCGVFQNYSFSSCLVAEKSKNNFEFDLENDKQLNNIFSYTDKIVKFETNLKMLKRLLNINVTTSYVFTHLVEFRDIIYKIVESHHKFEETKKLNVQIDPWDNYLYYDSKFFFDFLFAKNTNKNTTQIYFDNIEEKFIAMKFLLFVYHNDLMSNFKTDGKTIWWKLLDFLRSVTSDDKENYLTNFIRQVLINKIEPSEEDVYKFENKLETIFDLFIQDISSRKLFSEEKEDYFRI